MIGAFGKAIPAGLNRDTIGGMIIALSDELRTRLATHLRGTIVSMQMDGGYGLHEYYVLFFTTSKNVSNAKLIALGVTYEKHCLLHKMHHTNLATLDASYYCELVSAEIERLEALDVFCPSITDDNEASPIAGCKLAALRYAASTLSLDYAHF